MENLRFKGIVNGFVSLENLNGYVTIENVRDMITCVSNNVFKGSKYEEINKLIGVEELLDKKTDDLTDFECFKIVLASILIRGVEVIVCKHCFSSFDYINREKLYLLFTELRRSNICKFIIISNDNEILSRLCDYLVTDKTNGKLLDVYRKEDNLLPFVIRFSKRVKELKNIDIGNRLTNEDLMKDVYRYVE